MFKKMVIISSQPEFLEPVAFGAEPYMLDDTVDEDNWRDPQIEVRKLHRS